MKRRKIVLRVLAVFVLLGLAFLPLSGEWNLWGVSFALLLGIPAVLLFGATFLRYRIWNILGTVLASVVGISSMSFFLVTTAWDYGVKELFVLSLRGLAPGAWWAWLLFLVAFWSALPGGKQKKKEGRKGQPEVNNEKKYCPNCGHEVKSTAQFCNRCGARLGGADTEKAARTHKKKQIAMGCCFGIVLCALAAGILYSNHSFAPEVSGKDFPEGTYSYEMADISKDEDTGIYYINNILLVYFMPGTSEETKQEVADKTGGEIAGRQDAIDQIQVRVSARTYEELNALCSEVMEMEGVQKASVDLAFPLQSDHTPNDPYGRHWYNALWTDNTWDVDEPSGNNWWAEAVDAPGLWDAKDSMSAVTVGIVDSGFDADHEDLSIMLLNPDMNSPDNHGTHVSGLAGAVMDNEKGIAGMAPNAELVGWDWNWEQQDDAEKSWNTMNNVMAGLVACVEEGGARSVVNFSLGVSPESLKDSTGSDELSAESVDAYGQLASTYMAALLVRGYDFVVVQAAGNGDADGIGYDAVNSGIFCCVTEDNCETFDRYLSEEDVTDRILIVAATEKPDQDNGKENVLCDFSNYGDIVDIAAPGEDIYGLVSGKYDKISGTSMAAPIVAGTTAAVWGTAPELTGAQLKEILVSGTKKTASGNTQTEDTRTYPFLDAGGAVDKAMNMDLSQTDSGVYDAYMSAAAVTAATGTWTEDVWMTVELDGGESQREGSAETVVKDYDRFDPGKIKLTGEGFARREDVMSSWNIEYRNGTATYQYSQPIEQTVTQEIAPEFFNFYNLREEMFSNGSVSDGVIVFQIEGESLERAAGTTAEQLSQTEVLEYGTIYVTAQVDPASGRLASQTLEFTANMQYEGMDVPAECQLEYTFGVNEEAELQTSVPGNGTMSDVRDIVLVLDASGSMAESLANDSDSTGTPIEETKEAALKFVDTILREEASLGVVTYNNSSKMVSDFSVDRVLLEAGINSVASAGGTNMGEGLATAEEMLSYSSAEKKIIVLMSDGMPNEGKEGEELTDYAQGLKDKGITIYTLGFFNSLTEDEKADAQSLLTDIASDGYHYEVADAEELVFFFDDIADQINGQKYIYIKIACPVDVTVTSRGETLTSDLGELNTRTSFGTLTFEAEKQDRTAPDTKENVQQTKEGVFGYLSWKNKTDQESIQADTRIKILRLKEGTKYDVQIEGTGEGEMDYMIGFMDETGQYTDFRKFEKVEITDQTRIDTVAEVASNTVLNVDEDGDGKYDLKYKAGRNERGKIVDYTWIIYLVTGCVAAFLFAAVTVKIRRHCKKIKKPSDKTVI